MTRSEPSPSLAPARTAPRRRRTLTFVTAALLLIAFAPVTLAQTAGGDDSSSNSSSSAAPKKKKKKKKPEPAPSASATDTAAPSPPPAEPSATAAPETAPSESAAPAASSAPATVPNTPPDEKWDITDTREDLNKTYLFVGLRYRGTIIPQFFENIFVNDGATIYSNAVGVELDIRKGHTSTIPWIEYDDYSTGNMLFFQKGVADEANNYSIVQSNLKAIYLGVDERWSVNLVPDKLDYEFGFGVGIGGLFGSLKNDWAYQSNRTTPYKGSNGNYYNECPAGSDANSPSDQILVNGNMNACSPNSHTNSNGAAKVGGHLEPNWFQGGSVPTLFPHISIVPAGLRYKPIKMLELRVSVGLQLTGFFFNVSADYGLEQKPEAEHKTSRNDVRLRDTL
jgi:hypothetical protein